jgi:two-component system sensor histidine kinase DesK
VVALTADSLEVRDDGHGPGAGPGGDGGGSGLSGLRERAAAVGARVEVGQAPEGGFLLRVAPG